MRLLPNALLAGGVRRNGLLETEVLLRDRLELFAIVFLELLDSILVDGVGHDESMVGDLRNKCKVRKWLSTAGNGICAAGCSHPYVVDTGSPPVSTRS